MEKEHDYLRKFFYAPAFEKPFLNLLSKTSITPNQITWSTIALAAVIAILIITDRTALLLWAGILLIVRNGLDCLDGALARKKNILSEQGHKLDTFSDKFTEIVICSAILITLYIRVDSIARIGPFIILLLVGMGLRIASKQVKSFFLSLQTVQQDVLKEILKPVNFITRSILWRLSIIALALIFDQLALGLFIYLVLNILYALRESLPYAEWWMDS